MRTKKKFAISVDGCMTVDADNALKLKKCKCIKARVYIVGKSRHGSIFIDYQATGRLHKILINDLFF